ncbi:MAG TPA: hypothetical protein VHG71_12795 [Verrucomicrobiae bacterium]|nr:hypothetical protein [Verrucomicrobiae bacterium]
MRETETSQLYRGTTNHHGLSFSASIHFTAAPIATVELIFVGESNQFTDGVWHEIFEDLTKIVLRRNNYSIIDYSVAFTSEISDGNYSILDEDKRAYKTLHA